MFVPFHTIMIALLTTAKDMGVTGSIEGLIMVYCGLQCAIPIFLIRNFVIASVPAELEEAGRLDGCNTAQLFLLIAFPMLKPILATTAVLNALWIWNDFLLSYVVFLMGISFCMLILYLYV